MTDQLRWLRNYISLIALALAVVTAAWVLGYQAGQAARLPEPIEQTP